MFSGLMLANVLGVPFGTLLGQAFGWRMAFWAVAAFGLAAALAVWIGVPDRGPGAFTRLDPFMQLVGIHASLKGEAR
ncbi:hypothetical protein PQR26_06630 [Paraburkholderia sediminicola]